LAGWLLLCGLTAPLSAQSADPLRFVRWTADDVGAFARGAASTKSAILVGAVGSGVLLASRFDRYLAGHAEDLSDRIPLRARRILHEAGNVDMVRPLAVVVFLGSLTSGNEYFQDAAFTSLEAVVYANLITRAIKFAAGRARPNEGVGPGRFIPFSGARSMPSGHATTIIAFTTPWLLYYPGVVSAVLFTLGTGTALMRMADRYHWFSDVMAGGFIGAGTGWWLSRRHKRLAAIPLLSVSQAGLRLSVKL